MSATVPAVSVAVNGAHLMSIAQDVPGDTRPVIVRTHRRALPRRRVTFVDGPATDPTPSSDWDGWPEQLVWEHRNGWHIDAEESQCVDCIVAGGVPSHDEMIAALRLRNKLSDEAQHRWL